MRRIARHAFALCAAASLLVCAFSLAVLARGSRDYLSWSRAGGRFVSLDSVDGSLVVYLTRGDVDRAPRWQRTRQDRVLFPCAVVDGGPTYRTTDLFVAQLCRSNQGALVSGPGVYSRPQPATRVVAHWGMIAIVAGVIPAGWTGRRLWTGNTARDRLRRGACPACGYDLRATPDRCPECGAAGAGASATA